MLTIEDGAVSLTRGDTAYISLDLTVNGEEYEYQEGDTVTLSCRKDYDTPEYLFQITVPAGETIVIEPEHTKNLEYGRYKYDVQVNTAQGEVFTVVEPNTFKVAQEVTL